MWIRKAPYLLKADLPLITHHENCLQRALGVDKDRGEYAVLNRSRCKKS